MGSLDGKVGLIVGVANKRSLAWAIAQAAAREGARLVLTYQERFAEHSQELAATLDPVPELLPCDVQDDAQIDAVFARIAQLLQSEDPMLLRSFTGALFLLALGARVRGKRREPGGGAGP
mgnify:CR=1 FL=1